MNDAICICSDYSPPENEIADPSLNGYCVEASCHNNIIDSTFTLDQCDSSFCEVAVPTVPNIDNRHWFFDYVLYIGGTIHLLMSLTMVISYFLINAANFVLPDFFYRYMYVKLG